MNYLIWFKIVTVKNTMDKYDFIRDKIEERFDKDKWIVIEQSLRHQCKFVFLIWLELVKKKMIEELDEDAVCDAIDEWISFQKLESEYDRKYKDENKHVVTCKECVFKIGDEEKAFCIRYAKDVDGSGNCVNETNSESSEYYGELFDYLDMLGVYNLRYE